MEEWMYSFTSAPDGGECTASRLAWGKLEIIGSFEYYVVLLEY
jgi:hypothetical protein